MQTYYLNKIPQATHHVVHIVNCCPYPADEENRIYLGDFPSFELAIAAAKERQHYAVKKCPFCSQLAKATKGIYFSDEALSYCAETIVKAIREAEDPEAERQTPSHVAVVLDRAFAIEPNPRDMAEDALGVFQLSSADVLAVVHFGGFLRQALRVD